MSPAEDGAFQIASQTCGEQLNMTGCQKCGHKIPIQGYWLTRDNDTGRPVVLVQFRMQAFHPEEIDFKLDAKLRRFVMPFGVKFTDQKSLKMVSNLF